MRLVNTDTLKLEEFHGNNVPHYAILSHTWEKDEVSFQDMVNSTEAVQTKAGYGKVRQSALIAAEQGLSYIWVDTCCIDKSSSAELTEAINSMYRWYRDATICYAYVADVQLPRSELSPEGTKPVLDFWNDTGFDSDFRDSRYFTRGWTLQELIAPKEVTFYDKDWTRVDERDQVHALIEEITSIKGECLGNIDEVLRTSVSERMSWASRRQTTRMEDQAYCLMGIFDVYMPMMYGEGDRAFERLQEEILRRSNDPSIFAWTDYQTSYSIYRGLLARSPKDFRTVWGPFHEAKRPYTMTNRGLRLELYLVRQPQEEDLYLGFFSHHNDDGNLGIWLKRLSPDDDLFARVECCRLKLGGLSCSSVSCMETVYVPSKITFHGRHDTSRAELLQIAPRFRPERVSEWHNILEPTTLSVKLTRSDDCVVAGAIIINENTSCIVLVGIWRKPARWSNHIMTRFRQTRGSFSFFWGPGIAAQGDIDKIVEQYRDAEQWPSESWTHDGLATGLESGTLKVRLRPLLVEDRLRIVAHIESSV